MKRLILLTILNIVLGFTLLHAENGQNYYRYGDIKGKLNKRAIVEIAKGELRRVAIQKKVPKSWKFAPLLNIEKDSTQSHWIVSFHNSKIRHKKNKILYIHITTYGNIISSSYTQYIQTKH